jgi:hypothetical protein
MAWELCGAQQNKAATQPQSFMVTQEDESRNIL